MNALHFQQSTDVSHTWLRWIEKNTHDEGEDDKTENEEDIAEEQKKT